MVTLEVPERALTTAEVVRRGEAIYETHLRDLMEPQNNGKCLSIDVVTGQYTLIEREEDLAVTLHELGPSTSRYVRRVGDSRALYRYGKRAIMLSPRPHGS
jgi:hypothetical protein